MQGLSTSKTTLIAVFIIAATALLTLLLLKNSAESGTSTVINGNAKFVGKLIFKTDESFWKNNDLKAAKSIAKEILAEVKRPKDKILKIAIRQSSLEIYFIIEADDGNLEASIDAFQQIFDNREYINLAHFQMNNLHVVQAETGCLPDGRNIHVLARTRGQLANPEPLYIRRFVQQRLDSNYRARAQAETAGENVLPVEQPMWPAMPVHHHPQQVCQVNHVSILHWRWRYLPDDPPRPRRIEQQENLPQVQVEHYPDNFPEHNHD